LKKKSSSHAQTRTASIPPTLRVNGSTKELSGKPKLLLSEYLRDKLGLTGVKMGCETSNCGACTVLVKFLDESKYRAVKSCSLFAVQCSGCDVITIEGLAKDGDPSRIQSIFLEERGLQCGYCTPGFIMASVGLLLRNVSPTKEEIRHELSGNLCRCGAYVGILSAVKKAAEERAIPEVVVRKG
jgi:aerobic carbon-monoxide dehydrogenase small subunit